MLKFLNLISNDHESLMAFQSDPEGFLKRFDEISPEERKLLLSRDSMAVEWHLRNALQNGDADTTIHAATTVSVVAVILILAPEFDALDEEGASELQLQQHNDFWSHVTERGAAYAC